MITFDDAYANFAECAWPIMKRYGLPATLFVATAFPDNPRRIFWWDRLEHALTHTSRRGSLDSPVGRISLETAAQRMKAYRRLRDYVKTLPYSETLAWTHKICSELDAPEPEPGVLGWQTLRHLADEGVTIGAHTRSHRWLTQLSPEEVEAEVKGSLADVEKEIGAAPPIFAYPDGRFNEEVVEILKQAGIVLAFTTIRGVNDIRHIDGLRLRRINIGPRATPLTLRAWLLHASMPEVARRLLNGH
jgi:peptidoglycan/xylan/chitin deacetylase (PgdA/CDA1 family)